MECQQLINRKGYPVRCKLKATYEIRDNNEQVVEHLCTIHGERLVTENLINTNELQLVYVRKIR